MRTVYVHYGSTRFDPCRFIPISNIHWRNKPNGGLWASDVDAPYGWKQWCDDSGYTRERNKEDNCFKFHLSENAKILTLTCEDDIATLPQFDKCSAMGYKPNFEAIMKMGYDVIDYRLTDNPRGNLYYALYGWDCDSILVLNRNVIEPIKEA